MSKRGRQQVTFTLFLLRLGEPQCLGPLGDPVLEAAERDWHPSCPRSPALCAEPGGPPNKGRAPQLPSSGWQGPRLLKRPQLLRGRSPRSCRSQISPGLSGPLTRGICLPHSGAFVSSGPSWIWATSTREKCSGDCPRQSCKTAFSRSAHLPRGQNNRVSPEPEAINHRTTYGRDRDHSVRFCLFSTPSSPVCPVSLMNVIPGVIAEHSDTPSLAGHPSNMCPFGGTRAWPPFPAPRASGQSREGAAVPPPRKLQHQPWLPWGQCVARKASRSNHTGPLCHS